MNNTLLAKLNERGIHRFEELRNASLEPSIAQAYPHAYKRLMAMVKAGKTGRINPSDLPGEEDVEYGYRLKAGHKRDTHRKEGDSLRR